MPPVPGRWADTQRSHVPPVGLVPKWVRREERIDEILEAIESYSAHGKPVPPFWIAELRELVTQAVCERRP